MTFVYFCEACRKPFERKQRRTDTVSAWCPCGSEGLPLLEGVRLTESDSTASTVRRVWVAAPAARRIARR